MVSKRSIFEEVSDFDTERANPKIKTGIIEKAELTSFYDFGRGLNSFNR